MNTQCVILYSENSRYKVIQLPLKLLISDQSNKNDGDAYFDMKKIIHVYVYKVGQEQHVDILLFLKPNKK